jgi:Holliday junction DNA helicase RuvA
MLEIERMGKTNNYAQVHKNMLYNPNISSKAKGIGKKTAERIILELKESINAESASILENNEFTPSEAEDKDMVDAVSALRGLGISNQDALKAVKIAKTKSNNIEEIIAIALRNLG